MSFISELERLKEKATKGPWEWDWTQLWHFGNDYTDKDDPHLFTGIEYDKRLDKSPSLQVNAELIVFLRNHADEIAELVKAAVSVANPSGYGVNLAALNELRSALANLNKEKS